MPRNGRGRDKRKDGNMISIYGTVEGGSWIEVPLADSDIILEGISEADFLATYGAHMRFFVPANVPADAVEYRLTRLRLETKGWMAQHAYVERGGGAPDPGCTVIQGWVDGPKLQDSQAPIGGQPPGYVNHGNPAAANSSGVAEWTWGAGEGFDPITMEGAHWYWCSVPGCYTDVICGFGWRWGTEHWKMEPIFERVEPGEEPPDPGGDGDVAEAILELASQVGRIADKIQAQNWPTIAWPQFVEIPKAPDIKGPTCHE